MLGFYSPGLKRSREFVIQNVSFTAARDTDVTYLIAVPIMEEQIHYEVWTHVYHWKSRIV